MIPLRKVPEGYGIVKVTVTAAPGTFTPGAFSLSLRAPGNKYDFCRSAADLAAGPVAHGKRILKGIAERFNLDDEQLAALLSSRTEKRIFR